MKPSRAGAWVAARAALQVERKKLNMMLMYTQVNAMSLRYEWEG